MRLRATTPRLTGPLLFRDGSHPSPRAAVSRSAIFHAAERLCSQRGGTSILSVDGATCWTAKTLCGSSGHGTWTEVLGLWYRCELPTQGRRP